jgi:hypothetical protein
VELIMHIRSSPFCKCCGIVGSYGGLLSNRKLPIVGVGNFFAVLTISAIIQKDG